MSLNAEKPLKKNYIVNKVTHYFTLNPPCNVKDC